MEKPFFVSRNLNKESYKIVLPSFLKELEAELCVIEQTYSNEDLTLLRKTAHKIKGAAKAYGAASIADIAEKIEKELKENNKSNLSNDIYALKHQVQQAFKVAREEYFINI